MATVNIQHVATMHFKTTWGSSPLKYRMTVRLTRALTIGDFEVLELGVPYCPIDPTDDLFIIKALLKACRVIILASDQLPYWNSDTLWTCPESIKFDRAYSSVRVSNQDFVGNSILGLDFQSFYSIDCDYIPVASAYTPVPEEMEGMEDKELIGVDGGVFYPLKEEYNEGFASAWVAENKQTSVQFAWIDGYWAHIYAGEDLYENHLLRNIEIEEPYGTSYMFRDTSHNRGISAYDAGSMWLPSYDINYPYHTVTCFYKYCNSYQVNYFPTRTPVPPPVSGGFGVLMGARFLSSLLGVGVDDVFALKQPGTEG